MNLRAQCVASWIEMFCPSDGSSARTSLWGVLVICRSIPTPLDALVEMAIQIQRIILKTMSPLGSRAMHTVEIERLLDCITLFMAAIISKCEPTLASKFQCYAKYPHINCIILTNLLPALCANFLFGPDPST